jgi:hydrogenase maturation protein HypF
MGAALKASLCVIRRDRAWLSPPAGDLSELDALQRYERLLAEARAAAPAPACTGHDIHPDFPSTRAAQALGCPTLAVQHHHAHILATAWEHGVEGPVLGLALDGFGLGTDGAAWGGELMRVDGPGFERLGHLAPLPQPGGDAAARAPWRMAAAALHALGRGDEIAVRFADQPLAAGVTRMLAAGLACPPTSSAGRLFDAACGLLGVCPVAEFEGQAPMALEALADAPAVMPGGWKIASGVLDLLPLLDRLSSLSRRDGANLFHGTLAAALAEWVERAATKTGLTTVATGGGVFLNRVLRNALAGHLAATGLRVLWPERQPTGDAGLAFGQAVAAALHAERAGGS